MFKSKVVDLPWDKYPIIIAGGSFSSSNENQKISDSDKLLLDALLEHLDPEKVFFVVGHKVLGHEKYIIENKIFLHKKNNAVVCIFRMLVPREIIAVEN